MMPADSCFLVTLLKRFILEAKSNSLTVGYGLKAFITKSPIFSAIGIRTIQTGHKWMLFAMFVFPFCSVIFVSFVTGSINRCQ